MLVVNTCRRLPRDLASWRARPGGWREASVATMQPTVNIRFHTTIFLYRLPGILLKIVNQPWVLISAHNNQPTSSSSSSSYIYEAKAERHPFWPKPTCDSRGQKRIRFPTSGKFQNTWYSLLPTTLPWWPSTPRRFSV